MVPPNCGGLIQQHRTVEEKKGVGNFRPFLAPILLSFFIGRDIFLLRPERCELSSGHIMRGRGGGERRNGPGRLAYCRCLSEALVEELTTSARSFHEFDFSNIGECCSVLEQETKCITIAVYPPVSCNKIYYYFLESARVLLTRLCRRNKKKRRI